jgi:cell division protein FtsB
MYPENEPRHGGFGEMVFAGVAIALICYLAIAALQGEHGLFSMLRVEADEARLQEQLSDLQAERATLENKTGRLSIDGLDPDLLDEQARKVLGLARPDEIIVR